MSEFVFHPGALKDLDEIWEYIAGDSIDAADRAHLAAFAIPNGARLCDRVRGPDVHGRHKAIRASLQPFCATEPDRR
jgi:plasmid stabilization system protein ParE